MCGIIGYVGRENAVEKVLQGLKNLEYRGYDSYGIAWHNKKGLGVVRKVGKISEEKRTFPESRLAIGHTRWATHGRVSEENAHPHTNCSGDIAIVHNGIIENYQELRRELASKGHAFKSETDSEVIAHLIEEEVREGKDFENACMNAFRKLKGSYAVLAMKKGENRIIGARKDSPLVIGISENGLFAASDAPAFLQHTNKVAWLYNEDVITLAEEGFKVFNLSKERQEQRKVEIINWNPEQASRGEFKHFMLKEILEQVGVLKNISKRKDFETVAEEFENAEKLILTGSGTSYHACLVAEHFLVSRGVDARAVQSSEFAGYSNLVSEKTLIVAVSQSGETADVLEAVKIAKSRKARILSLVNVKGSSLERESDLAVMTNAGPEIGVLSTKAYTSQVAILLTISSMAFDKKSDIKLAWNELYNLTSISSREKIKKIAGRMKNARSIMIIGRGKHYATALEAGLKIREVSYIPALSFAGGELKHGNIALVEEGTPCIVFGDDSETISNALEMKSRGGWIIGVSKSNNPAFDDWIKVYDSGEFDPVMFVIPAQVLAYYTAVLKGLDPDKPRNLAKSVTVK